WRAWISVTITASRMPTFASHPLARISQKTLKALAKRLLKEHGVQPASIDAMTLDEVIWWLTD
ncbi:hypothetical protein SB778_34735, partial [Paraburkholderia sp. SIMBA_050]